MIDLKGAFVSPGFNDAHVHIESARARCSPARTCSTSTSQGVPRAHCAGSVTAADRQLDHARRLGRVRAMGRRAARARPAAQARQAAPSCRIGELIDDVTPNHPVLVNRFDRSVFLANTLALEARGHHRRDAESCERRIRPRRERTPDRRPARVGGRRSCARSSRRSPFEQRLVAGPRRAEGSTRGRRDDDAGPDVGASSCAPTRTCSAWRADVAHHAAPDAGQRRAHRAARHHAAASATTG